MLTIYLFTLEPPIGWIPLKDPFVALVAYEPAFAKDLFFSGHTATLCCLIFFERNGMFKGIKVVATLIVALFLLIQHIHYTVDIVGAPLFTYAAFLSVKRFVNAETKTPQLNQNKGFTS